MASFFLEVICYQKQKNLLSQSSLILPLLLFFLFLRFFQRFLENRMETETASSVMDTGYKKQTLNKLMLKVGKEYQFQASFENLININVDDNYVHIGKNMAQDLIDFLKDEIKTNNYRIYKLSQEV